MDKGIAYILNPDKTEQLLYTAAINCTLDPYEAYTQMKLVYEQYTGRSYDEPMPEKGNGRVKAIHYIMSFAKSENVTPEMAHKIGKAFVRKAFGDDVQAVIATHTNTDCVHNHIIINTYALDGHKFNANKASLHDARVNTNGVCQAFGVTPALNFEGKGRSMKYNEWEHKQNGTSWKQQIRDEIDRLIPTVITLEELLQALRAEGYQLTQATLSRDLKQLKVAKAASMNGNYVYVLPNNTMYKRNVDNINVTDVMKQRANGFISINFSGNIAVIKTRPGYASSLAYDIDDRNYHEIIGTIAGDDTILLVIREGFTPGAVVRALRDILPNLQA